MAAKDSHNTNTLLRDLNLVVQRQDERRIKVIANGNGLPRWSGGQLAVDPTSVPASKCNPNIGLVSSDGTLTFFRLLAQLPPARAGARLQEHIRCTVSAARARSRRMQRVVVPLSDLLAGGQAPAPSCLPMT